MVLLCWATLVGLASAGAGPDHEGLPLFQSQETGALFFFVISDFQTRSVNGDAWFILSSFCLALQLGKCSSGRTISRGTLWTNWRQQRAYFRPTRSNTRRRAGVFHIITALRVYGGTVAAAPAAEKESALGFPQTKRRLSPRSMGSSGTSHLIPRAGATSIMKRRCLGACIGPTTLTSSLHLGRRESAALAPIDAAAPRPTPSPPFLFA